MRCLAFVIIVNMLLAISASASYADSEYIYHPDEAENVTQQSLEEELGADKLPDIIPPEAGEVLERDGEEFSVGSILTLTFDELVDMVGDLFWGTINSVRLSLMGLVGVILISALLGVIEDGESFAYSKMYSISIGLIISLTLLEPVLDCINGAIAALENCATFFLSYVPIFGGIVATSGMPASAAMYTGSVLLVSQIVAQLSTAVLLPMLCVYLAMNIVGAVCRVDGVVSLSAAFKNLVNWSLTLLVSVFVGLLALQSVISSTADLATSRTVKFLFSSFIPVVGAALSDAVVAAQSGLRVIKASVGSFGIVVAAAVFLPVLVNVTTWRIALSLAVWVGETVGDERSKTVLKGFLDVLSIITAILLSLMLIMVITTALMLSSGGGS